MEETVAVSLKTVHRHARSPGEDRAASTALTYINIQVAHQIFVQAIMSKDMQFVTIGVQFKDA